MEDVIGDYQRWKHQGAELRTKAKQAMQARFRELLTEAVRLAEEYRADFGAPLAPPPVVTAFRYKSSPKKSTKPAAALKAPAPEPPAPAPAKKRDRKTAALERSLAAAKKKLDAAKGKGAPTRDIEDRIYEIEDQLRLAAQA
ncbi:MAG: hypothetical protein ACK5AZ_04270 [Bryobacteraceae bacterium]